MERFLLSLRQTFDAAPVRVDAVAQPDGGLFQDLAGQAVPDRGAHGIFIGPGTEAASGMILLDGCEAVFQDRFRGLVQFLLCVRILHGPHCTEVQQFGAATGVEHDIVRTDVPVDDAALMDLRQRFHHGPQDPEGLFDSQPSAPHPDIFSQVHAPDIFHDDIGGVVLLYEVQDGHDFGDVLELYQRLGFPEEPFPTALEVGDSGLAAAFHGVGLSTLAEYGAAGIEFLDGDASLHQRVPCHIGDAETALTQYLTDLVPVPDHGAGLQLMLLVLCAAAVGTYIFLVFPEAAVTTFHFQKHQSFLFFI